MNFSPSYYESPPKRSNPVIEQKQRNAYSDNPKESQPKKKEKHRKEAIINLDWSSNGLSSLDSLNLFPDLLTLNLSDNQIKEITSEVKLW